MNIINFSVYLGWTYFASNNLLLNLLILDLIFISKQFTQIYLRYYHQEKWYLKYESCYDVSWIDRIVIYLAIYGCYSIISCLFWNNIPYLELYIPLFVIPQIWNYINNNIFDQLSYYHTFKNNVITKNLSLISTTFIEFFSKTYLYYSPKLSIDDGIRIVHKIRHIGRYALEFIKSLLVYYFMEYLRPGPMKLVYRITKYTYKKQSHNEFSILTLTKARELLVEVFKERKWILLVKPLYVQALILVIKNHDDDRNPIKWILEKLWISGLRILSFYVSSYLHPSIPLLLTAFSLFVKFNKYSVPISILSGLFYYFLPYHYYLLELGILIKEINYFPDEIDRQKIIKKVKGFDFTMLGYCIGLIIMKLFKAKFYYYFIFTTLILFYLNKYSKINSVLIVFLASLSNFNIYHIIYLFFLTTTILTVSLKNANDHKNAMIELEKDDLKTEIKEEIKEKIATVGSCDCLNDLNDDFANLEIIEKKSKKSLLKKIKKLFL